MNKNNPKNLYGINIPDRSFYLRYEGMSKVTVYHNCMFCHNTWETKEIAVGKEIHRQYDYCSECYKNS